MRLCFSLLSFEVALGGRRCEQKKILALPHRSTSVERGRGGRPTGSLLLGDRGAGVGHWSTQASRTLERTYTVQAMYSSRCPVPPRLLTLLALHPSLVVREPHQSYVRIPFLVLREHGRTLEWCCTVLYHLSCDRDVYVVVYTAVLSLW
jgi:hypothetical protein